MRTAPRARLLHGRDLLAIRELLGRDPVQSVLVASRLIGDRLDRRSMGGALWGYGDEDRLAAVCFSGANLIPVGTGPDAIDSFASMAEREGRRCSSIVGPQEAVVRLWDQLEPAWGAAREIRWHQPLMAMTTSPLIAPDPTVRLAQRSDFDSLLEASVAMYTEEIGVSPLWYDGGGSYRSRVRSLIDQGSSFVRVEDGEVVFKAELGAITPQCVQVQGVWVRPDRRGDGLGARGMASVVQAALDRGAPIVSLYVNEFNEPAIRAYRRVGFQVVGDFMSVLF